MKKNIVLSLALALLLSGVPGALAFAEDGGANSDQSSTTKSHIGTDGNQDNSGSGTSTNLRGDENNQEQDHATGTATSTNNRDDNKGEITSDEHRSKVVDVVHSLLQVADREDGSGNKGIGEEVRKIAQEQNDTATTTTDSLDHVSKRSSLLTFLIGSDYKNLGHIRSSIATTSANISQLENLRDKATTNADKALITAQITALKAEQDKLDAFVTSHENVFSLFGWFVKLFSSP